MEKEYIIKSPHKATIKVNDHSLTLTRKGFLSGMSHGFKGEKTIPFKNITAVQLKKPGLTNGYIQFSLMGGGENKGGVFAATQDENTIMITKKNYEDMIELKTTIEDYIYNDGPKTSDIVPPQQSPAAQLREYKELLDDGIITENEFNKKKTELLG